MKKRESIKLTAQQLEFLRGKVEALGTRQAGLHLSYVSDGSINQMIKRGEISPSRYALLLKWMAEPKQAPSAAPTQAPAPRIHLAANPVPPPRPQSNSITGDMANTLWAKLSEHDRIEAIMLYLSKTL